MLRVSPNTYIDAPTYPTNRKTCPRNIKTQPPAIKPVPAITNSTIYLLLHPRRPSCQTCPAGMFSFPILSRCSLSPAWPAPADPLMNTVFYGHISRKLFTLLFVSIPWPTSAAAVGVNEHRLTRSCAGSPPSRCFPVFITLTRLTSRDPGNEHRTRDGQRVYLICPLRTQEL